VSTVGYTFECDDCGTEYTHMPAFMGEFRESFLESSREGGTFADAGYRPGSTVTICAHCMQDVL